MVYITEALLIKKSPLEQILHGHKIFEVRGETCNIRGWVGLVQSCGEGPDPNNGFLRAVVHLRDSMGPLTLDQMNDPRMLYLTGRNRRWEQLPYPRTYFWVVDEIQELDDAFIPPRRQGQVKWIKFNPMLYVQIEPTPIITID